MRDSERRIAGHIEALADSDPKVSFRAERRLIRFGAKAIPQLIAEADSPNPQVRFRLAWVLGKTRDPAAFDTLCQLAKDVNSEVKYDAVLALGELGDPRAVPVLNGLAAQPDDEAAISSAARTALSRLKRGRGKSVRHLSPNNPAHSADSVS